MVAVDLRAIGGSALTSEIEVPKDRAEIGGDVPVTYVPARNTVFLALLTGLAEVLGAPDLVIGANVQDYSGYPDCRPEFLRAFAGVAGLGTKAGVEGARFAVHAPLLHLSKAGIVRLGAGLGVDYAATLSCYDPPEAFGTAAGATPAACAGPASWRPACPTLRPTPRAPSRARRAPGCGAHPPARRSTAPDAALDLVVRHPQHDRAAVRAAVRVGDAGEVGEQALGLGVARGRFFLIAA